MRTTGLPPVSVLVIDSAIPLVVPRVIATAPSTVRSPVSVPPARGKPSGIVAVATMSAANGPLDRCGQRAARVGEEEVIHLAVDLPDFLRNGCDLAKFILIDKASEAAAARVRLQPIG